MKREIKFSKPDISNIEISEVIDTLKSGWITTGIKVKKLEAEIAKYGDVKIEYLERFAFYERAKKAYAIIATGEKAQYANVILKKGVVKEQ